MAEKGILVEDATTGESVACRDAVELDNASNPRVIQRMDIGKGPLPTPFRDSANLLRSAVYVDGDDSENFFGEYGSGVDDNLLTVGDKSTFVVQVKSNGNTTAEVKLVPVLLEDDGTTIQGVLEAKVVDFATSAGKLKIVGGEYDNFYLGPIVTWDVTGGTKLAVIIMSNSDPYTSFDIYGAVI